MQDKLGFGGASHMSFLFRFSTVILYEFCLIFVLFFDMYVIILYLN